MATRTCEGRPLAGAGGNLKSVSDRLLPAIEAASLGSALAGVKAKTGSALSETAAGRFFDVLLLATAGVSTRPPAASAASNPALFDLANVNTCTTPCCRVDIANRT